MGGTPAPETKTYSKPTYTRNVLIRRRNTSRKAATHCSNGVAVEATNKVYCLAPHLFSQSLTAQRICAISSDTDKNSNHSIAKLSAWWVRTLCANGKI